MSKALCKKVPERQKEFGREIEKIQIFLDKSLPILKAHQNSYAKTRRRTKSAQKKKKNEEKEEKMESNGKNGKKGVTVAIMVAMPKRGSRTAKAKKK